MSFRFKQFYVDDSRCAMKVGTDGVLLGAWAECGDGVCRLLDVGTGSGLVALMLAQRNPYAHISAIDIDANAIAQTSENFRNSLWNDRLECTCIALQDYSSGKFDYIVSNPPFFNNSLKAPDAARSTARHTDTLSTADLFSHSARLLNDSGVFSLIVPAWDEDLVMQTAKQYGFSLKRCCRVKGREEKPVKRLLLSFTKETKEQNVIEENLVLEEGINSRTAAYSLLAREFYL